MDAGLVLLHVDDALVVIDKPAGLLSVPGRGAAGADNAATRVQQRWPDARVVHRLDMATSGLLLFARGAHAQRLLSMAFARRAVHKGYIALVAGLLADDEGQIDAPLAADWPNRPRQQVDRIAGKSALTRWTVLARDPAGAHTRVALEPVTGRSHQLRVHLLSIGHPVLGDMLYAPEHAAPRLMLHAAELAIDHPLHGRRCHWHSDAPF